MAVLKDMVSYLRTPVMNRERRAFTPQALLELLRLLGVAFVLLIMAGIFMGAVFQTAGVTMPEPAEGFTEMMNSPNFIFLAAIAAPLIEELLFRSWLGRGWGVLLVAPMLLVLVALLIITGADSVDLGIKLGTAGAVLGAALLYLRRYLSLKDLQGVLEAAARRVFPYAFWGSCLAFGLMHLGNYQDGDMGLLLPLIVLPQFLVGIILGFVRMRYGLLCAIGFHAGYNISVLTVFTLLSQAVP